MPKNSKGIEIAEINPDKCIGCQICIAECPVGAIELNSDGVAEIDPETCVGCGKCYDVCPVEAISFHKKEKREKAPTERQEEAAESVPGYQGIAVYIELQAGEASEVAWELIGKARELAKARQTEVIGFVLGKECQVVAKQAISRGCDQVHMIEHPVFENYFSTSYGEALSWLADKVKPEVLLMGATHLGRDLAGIVATKLNTGLTADCTGLDIDPYSGLLLMTRPTFGGNIMATIYCEKHRPQMSTVRPKVMRAPEQELERKGSVQSYDWEPPDWHLPELVESVSEVSESDIDIAQYPALVVAGKGACDSENLELLQELADVLGGALACSRPVVELGVMPYERQVGQTGKTVAPKLYIGVGVSGAIQHRVGIQGSEKIVAINTDPEAAIFQVADVGIVGDYSQVVPEFIRQLKSKNSKLEAKS